MKKIEDGLTNMQRYCMRNSEKIKIRSSTPEAKAKAAARKKRDYAENPEKHRIWRRKQNGIINPTGEVKTGPCLICRKTKRLCLDHDWKTGRVRGWLCISCNTKLGWWERHSADILGYLEPHK